MKTIFVLIVIGSLIKAFVLAILFTYTTKRQRLAWNAWRGVATGKVIDGTKRFQRRA